ncbi:hypothetical protein ACFVVX_00765 [Kitasatospora sp. NPDC058170]|uniref:hypothetical protein n=1 Tax=Kitasatospora sp. NPDC058170 TaxID=3346364 RepID=UPI0036DB2725
MTSTAANSATPPPGRPASPRLPASPGADDLLPVGPGGPWSVRNVRAGRSRAALEVYEHGELVDVLVAARLTPQLLRGARRGAVGARRGAAGGGRAAAGGRVQEYALAWGRLPQDGLPPVVGFTAGRLRWPGRPARATGVEVLTVAGEFWLAWAAGPFDGVLVEYPGGCERQSLGRLRRPSGRTVGSASEILGGVA